MTVWDGIIIALFVLQLAALGAIGYYGLKIKNGPVSGVIRRIKRLLLSVRSLARSGQTVYVGNAAQVRALWLELQGVWQGVDYATRSDFGRDITYKSLFKLYGTAQATRLMAANALGFVFKKTKQSSVPQKQAAGKRTAPRRSLADRMGLVPPVAKHFGKFYAIGRTALLTYRQLKQQGLF
ncbi:MAG: hypothetical protein OHK0029_26650 [Armatimonadaceae bacterium]